MFSRFVQFSTAIMRWKKLTNLHGQVHFGCVVRRMKWGGCPTSQGKIILCTLQRYTYYAVYYYISRAWHTILVADYFPIILNLKYKNYFSFFDINFVFLITNPSEYVLVIFRVSFSCQVGQPVLHVVIKKQIHYSSRFFFSYYRIKYFLFIS